MFSICVIDMFKAVRYIRVCTMPYVMYMCVQSYVMYTLPEIG